MDTLFELPKLLFLNGDKFRAIRPETVQPCCYPNGCTVGCDKGCNGGSVKKSGTGGGARPRR